MEMNRSAATPLNKNAVGVAGAKQEPLAAAAPTPKPIEQKENRTRKRRTKKKKPAKFKKAPQAPRRFKSAYMFFSTDKHKEIRDQLGADGISEKVRDP